MNERIKLLAEQAESSRLEYNSATMMTERIQEFDKQKFAQLIVRECAKIADVADENKCEWIGGNILTHFGVEE